MNYTGLAATASRLIETNGAAVTLTRKPTWGTNVTPWIPQTRTLTYSSYAVAVPQTKDIPNPQNAKEKTKTFYLKAGAEFVSGPTWTGNVTFFRNDIINQTDPASNFTTVFATGDTIEVSGALLAANNIQDTPALIDTSEMTSDNFTDDATVQEVTISLVMPDDPEVLPGDFLTFGSDTLEITSVETLAPGGTTLIYIVQARAI